MTIRNNPGKRRYEAVVDGEIAGFLFYQERDGPLALIHTEVAEEFEGRGIGSRLAAGALDEARERGVRVIPVCPFVRGYLERHPEYGDLVEAEPGID